MSPAAWWRAGSVVIRPASEGDLEHPGIEQALRDGIERGYAGALPACPAQAEQYAIEADGELAGLIAFRRDVPREGALTFDAIAIVRERRGHAYGAWALIAAEERLAREGILDGYARVPRGNGHGVYFMLRCGYAPLTSAPDGEDAAAVTWFRRNPAIVPHGRPSRARRDAVPSGGRRPSPSRR